MAVNWADLERAIGVQRTVPPAPTRADIDNLRRRKLSKRWRGVKATRKPAR